MRLPHVTLLAAAILGPAVPAVAQTPYLVHDINPGGNSSVPTDLLAAGERIYFMAFHPAMSYEVWSSLGTSATTQGIDLKPGPEPGPFPVLTLALGDQAIFGQESAQGSALYRTDGTQAGTTYLAAINPLGAQTSAVRDGVGVFRGITPRAYRTDGTPQGTYHVRSILGEIWMGHDSQFLAPFRDGFAIPSTATGTSYEVLLSDPLANTARCVVCGQAVCLGAMPVDERLFMSCGAPAPVPSFDLWLTDGTYAGVRLVKDLPATPYPKMAALNGILYFAVPDGPGPALWRSDGTDAGTFPLSTIATMPTNVDVDGWVVSSGRLYFSGETPGTGRELWTTDGTGAGTVMLADIRPGPASSITTTDPRWIAPFANGVVFAATTDAGGRELWKSDGTTVGTGALPEIAPGPASSSPAWLTRAGGRVFLSANDGAHGRELWAIDQPPGALEVGDAIVTEGDAGATVVRIPVRLQSPSPFGVTAVYSTAPITALAGIDFVSQTGTLDFDPGVQELSVEVPVIGDLEDERDESFALQLLAAGGAPVARWRGVAVVLDDDAPRVTASGGTAVEGNIPGPTNTIGFTVTLATKTGAPAPDATAVTYNTTSGSAWSEVDYSPAGGVLTFPAGSPSGTSRTFGVQLRGDTEDEPDETFFVRIAGDAAGPLPTPAGVITDDDGIDAGRARELSHGAVLRTDLAPPPGRTQDRDWYVLWQDQGASYELVVDEISGDATPLQVERLLTFGTPVIQAAVPVGTGTALSLRWQNDLSGPNPLDKVRVGSIACGTACGADDTYRVRFYETTLRAPRINNTGGQATVVTLQNTSQSPVAGVIHMRPQNGDEYAAQQFQVPPRGTFVYNSAATLAGFTGSVTVSHDAPYGVLVGKLVSFEPATGFAFDTPLTYRPR